MGREAINKNNSFLGILFLRAKGDNEYSTDERVKNGFHQGVFNSPRCP